MKASRETEQVVTREMLATDYPAVSALWAQVDGVEIAEGDSAEEIRGYLARNPGLSRVAREGEQVVGAALCGHDGRRGLIYHLTVAPTSHGRGIGKSLVEECIAGLRRVGIRRAIIFVAADNQKGQAFWERQGWEVLSFAVPMARDVT